MGEFVQRRNEGRIGIVTLDRPDALNALSTAMAAEVADAFEELAGDSNTWVVVLNANGERAFCVGADLKERSSFELQDYHDNRRQIFRMFRSIRSLPQPVIAAVFGHALGGGFELALSCDLIVAAEGTMLGLPEARVGLLPAGGGTQLLTRKIGPVRAKELIFTGARITAERACELGLVSRVAPRAELEQAALGLAGDILECSPVAVHEAKACIDAAMGVPLEIGVGIEGAAWARVISSEDRKEGVAAFNDKREPIWTNR